VQFNVEYSFSFVWILLYLFMFWYVSCSQENGDAARACICCIPHNKISVGTARFCVNVRVSVSIGFYSIVEIMFLAYVLNLTHFLGTTPEPGYQCVHKKGVGVIILDSYRCLRPLYCQNLHRRKDLCSWWWDMWGTSLRTKTNSFIKLRTRAKSTSDIRMPPLSTQVSTSSLVSVCPVLLMTPL
jgi:hypothetical protein